MVRKLVTSVILLSTISAHAGFHGPTAHSRANCLTINESIFWDATAIWTSRILDVHSNAMAKAHHADDSKVQTTYRNAIVHVGESINPQWTVAAVHNIYTWTWFEYMKTAATDCSIYDGWWDSDHPERRS